MDLTNHPNHTSQNTSIFLHNCYHYFNSTNRTVTERIQFLDANELLWYAEPRSMNNKTNIWIGDDPFNRSIPVFMAQVSMTALGTTVMKSVLEPIGVTSFVAQMIAGLLMGPSLLGQTDLLKTKIFTYASLYTLETIQYFGSMFFLFLIGVKTDIGMVKKSGKMALLVGLFSFCLSLILAISAAFIMAKDYKTHFPEKAPGSIFYVAGLTSLSSPHVINSFLADLNLLSSQLGRIAVSASMISGGCSLVSVFLALTLKQSLLSNQFSYNFWATMIGCFAIIIVIIYVIRPIMLWVHKRTAADHKAVEEGYILCIFLTVLVSSLAGECVGQHYLVGPLLLGLVVPPGPPLGAAIEEKLDSFVTAILVPVIVISRACPFKVSDIKHSMKVVVWTMTFFGFLGKLLGTMLPAVYSKMPYPDAIILGLIMSVQGVLDIQIWVQTMNLQLIDRDIYGSLVILMVAFTGSISVIVKFFYDPARKYASYRMKTIQHSKPNAELRILPCVYHKENVPSIVSLLEASNPTTHSPICVYPLHLVQLQGRATPLLIAHKTDDPNDPSEVNDPTARTIINSFKAFAHHNKGIVSVNSFTAISPYNTMHDDICTLGLDKRTSLIIIPFHHQPAIHTKYQSSNAIRRVNTNVLNKAPCSVGILIDKGATGGKSCNSISPPSNVTVIFLGGPDDREALAYGARMGDDISVKLTVIRFMHSDERKHQKPKEERIDDDIVYAFRFQTAGCKNVKYVEEVVKDGVELISRIKGMESSFELLIVGREHGAEASKLFEAFNQWIEFPELGIIGDMLVSSDSKMSGSILVMQQHQQQKKKKKENKNNEQSVFT
ncbi:hypothetical protein MKW92_049204 [Papaver armeniacum]|nr:hypothetical protein MKW92_049204 [Papaver armeniacum]